MKEKISIVLGGIQGEGIASAGNHLLKILSRFGYYGISSRSFSSRIKGGNTTFVLTIGTKRIMAVEDKVDILLAFDKDTIGLYKESLKEEGIILYDSLLNFEGEEPSSKMIAIPLTEIAKKIGMPIMKTTAAVGFIGRMLGLPTEALEAYFKDQFLKKGETVQVNNMKVLEEIIKYEEDIHQDIKKVLVPPVDRSPKLVMTGNEAIGLGALMAGCRFMAAYPITPASEIMEYLGKLLPKYGGKMLQVEDEIAAITMATGAGYAGVRSMTATSGPGISLMMEGIGMAAMGEIPVVVVDVQRVGPSTGMPTKHEQSDLASLYYGGHGDYPSIIITPATVEDCFKDTIKAFNLAEKYQCPVIIISDLMLSLSPQTIHPLDYNDVEINRGSLIKKEILESMETGSYKRFDFTDEGISLRSLPGMKNGLHHVTGVEHTEKGLPTENFIIRKKMIEKRMKKVEELEKEENVEIIRQGSNMLCLAIGSTFGVLKEAVELNKHKVDYGTIKLLKPLPIDALRNLLNSYEKVIIFENNYCQQFTSIIKAEVGFHHKLEGYVKYDGSPFTVTEILNKIGGLQS